MTFKGRLDRIITHFQDDLLRAIEAEARSLDKRPARPDVKRVNLRGVEVLTTSFTHPEHWDRRVVLTRLAPK